MQNKRTAEQIAQTVLTLTYDKTFQLIVETYDNRNQNDISQFD